MYQPSALRASGVVKSIREKSSLKRLPPHGRRQARQEVGGVHAVVAAAEDGRLAVLALREPLGGFQPLLEGDRLQLRRVVDAHLVEERGVVPEHGVLGEVLRHAVARPLALGAAVVAPQVVDRVQVVEPEHRAPGEVRVQVLHHLPRREVRRVRGTDAAHQVGRVAVGHHPDQLGEVVPHRDDLEAEILLGLLDQFRGDVVGLRHHRDGLARATHPGGHLQGAAVERRGSGRGAGRREGEKSAAAQGAPACGRMNAPPPALSVRDIDQRSDRRSRQPVRRPVRARPVRTADSAIDPAIDSAARSATFWATGCLALGQSFFLSGNDVKSLGEFSKRLCNLGVMGQPAEPGRWNAA